MSGPLLQFLRPLMQRPRHTQGKQAENRRNQQYGECVVIAPSLIQDEGCNQRTNRGTCLVERLIEPEYPSASQGTSCMRNHRFDRWPADCSSSSFGTEP